MSKTFDERFRTEIPDTSKITGIYIDRAKSNYREPSTYVIAFNVSGFGSVPYRVPVTEAMLVAKSRIDNFDDVPVVISERASPVLTRNKTIAGLLGAQAKFQRDWSRGVFEYQPHKTIRAKGCEIHI